ncbi:amine oxidase [Aspergillus bombycis]|uniref:Amine oxidase n=1 Tax=Aspergillus bombycis TaxID=109264 RepID=A0A1F7ZNR0_9EURO|nr:amine oxidase [Aspergillus bombycis]OGM40768.1 amine oxidase [Aspergillus bombycis]
MEPSFRRYTCRLLALGLLQIGWASVLHKQTELVRFRVPDITADSLHNVHIDFIDSGFQGEIQLLYGDCDISTPSQEHHEIGSMSVKRDAHPERFVWVTPLDAPHLHCLHAYSGSTLVGKSAPVSVAKPLIRRENIADVADLMGPWFDGVSYMQAKEPGKAVVAQAKDAAVAIIGGGVSGLMTSLLLESIGMHNWHIIESSGRIGGRIRTEYMNNTRPDQYQYQEMGPMRFPLSITYADNNQTVEIQDHKMVTQLSDVLNGMNLDHPELVLNFIPFIEKSPNVPASSDGYRLPNGLIPTTADIAANSSLVYKAASSNATATADAVHAYTDYTTASNISGKIVTDMYRAHKSAVESGYFHWSEAGYLRYALGYNDNITDYVAGSENIPMWESLYDRVYSSATKWCTIDKGLESLPRAFWPHVANKTTLNRKVQGLSFNETSGKIAVSWRHDPMQLDPESAEYDYAVVSAPFSKVRLWDMPRYSSLLSRAISTLNYGQCCKMSLHFKTRFWEHQEKPIYGGCGSVDLPGIGSVCYPSFNIHGTGPGVVLASYVIDTQARSIAALSTEDHVSLVLRAMVEIHGRVAAEQYTGIYSRQCWEVDEHQAGAWAAPLVGQQELYLPAYYQTEFKTIFIGEHTSYTHAWIFSALDSAVRGTTQLLLDPGLVDEAKTIVNTWMGRWIKV